MGATDGGKRIEEIRSEYKLELADWQQRDSSLKKAFVLNGWLRLVFFVSAFVLPFVFFEHWSFVFFLTFFICFSVFLRLVWRAGKISSQRRYAFHRIALLQQELNASNGQWTEAKDGSEFIDPQHDFAHDLDLFGKGSLFQFVNRTSTNGGLHRLVYKLKYLSLSVSDISSKQEAVQELASHKEFRQHFYALGALVEEGNKRNKKMDLHHGPDLNFISTLTKVVMSIHLVFVLMSFVMVGLGIWRADIIAYLFFIGLTIVGIRLKKINRVHSEVGSLGNYLKCYAELIHWFESKEFDSAYLKWLQNKLVIDNASASAVMRKLGGIIRKFDQRLNMLLGVVLNGFLLWDLFICVRLKMWYDKYGAHLDSWVTALNEVDAMNSLAAFAYNHPDYVFPELNDQVIFSAKDLGHPLIAASERVNNDFEFVGDQRICVVTGANMAGKSTFLRTVGVALVLAGNGCVVAANRFAYKPMPFVTNMRAIDNLLKHESYFFAELSRLQMILERLKTEGELFFILDEILKGTNSLDKYQGSMALIKQFLLNRGCGLVATHDLELGQLAEQTHGQVFNNCFEVSFNDEGLAFDYKLRTGVTASHNATWLMEKMGLIPSENVRR